MKPPVPVSMTFVPDPATVVLFDAPFTANVTLLSAVIRSLEPVIVAEPPAATVTVASLSVVTMPVPESAAET